VSRSRIDALRLAYEALERHNRSAAAAVLHPEFALIAPEGWTGSEQTYLGAVGLGRFLDEHARVVDGYGWVPRKYTEIDERHLLVLVREVGYTRARRVPIEPRFATHAWTMPGSFATRLEIHAERPLILDGERLAAEGL
jgi:hypothetical protein